MIEHCPGALSQRHPVVFGHHLAIYRETQQEQRTVRAHEPIESQSCDFDDFFPFHEQETKQQASAFPDL